MRGVNLNNLAPRISYLETLIDRLTTVSLVGLDIGSAALKVVELEVSRKQIFLSRASVQSVSSEKNPASSLRDFLRNAKISAKSVAIGIASPEVTARVFSFPPMPKREFQQAIRLEADRWPDRKGGRPRNR